jgi:hypothetical protein
MKNVNNRVFSGAPEETEGAGSGILGGLGRMIGGIFGGGGTALQTPASSSGPTTWTAVADRAFGTRDNTINAIAWGNNRFVVVGYHGEIAYADW